MSACDKPSVWPVTPSVLCFAQMCFVWSSRLFHWHLIFSNKLQWLIDPTAGSVSRGSKLVHLSLSCNKTLKDLSRLLQTWLIPCTDRILYVSSEVSVIRPNTQPTVSFDATSDDPAPFKQLPPPDSAVGVLIFLLSVCGAFYFLVVLFCCITFPCKGKMPPSSTCSETTCQ